MSGLFTNEPVTIPGWQKAIHVATEAASVLMVPFVFRAAADARQPHKNFLRFLGAGMLVVDGFLLMRWLGKSKKP